MHTKKVFISRILPDITTQLLKEVGLQITQWTKNEPVPRAMLHTIVKEHNALLCSASDVIDTTFLEACSHLDIISQYAAGFDNINVSKATALGIPICNTPDTMSEATADIAFGLLLATARNMFANHKKITTGNWGYSNLTKNLGIELKGKTLGIVGMGTIGLKMAERCKGAYGMKILYHNRNTNAKAEKLLDATYVSFETLLKESDVISVHAPLTPATKGLFNMEVFKQMKSTAIFINTARGGIHNETDLINAIKNGIIWGAGLDVTNPEPMQPDNPLLHLPNVCVVPHIGSATVEARTAMGQMAAENIINYYTRKGNLHLVNPEVM